MRIKSFTLLAALALVFTGCTASDSPDESTTEETQAAATTPAPETTPTTISATPAEPTPSASSPLATASLATASAEPSERSPHLSTERANTYLVLNDFAAASSDWRDGVFQIAEKSDITGIGTELNYCIETPQSAGMDNLNENSTQALRLNLGHKFDSLKFEVGQENDSAALDQNMAVRITDGTKQIGEINTVAFDEYRTIDVPVTGRNVIIIQVYIPKAAGESCSSSSISPVIYKVELD